MYPVGSDETVFAAVDEIGYVKGDPTQTVTVVDDYHVIYLTVEAENGDQRIYVVKQVIPLSSNSLLADLQLNGSTIAGFADSVFYYEYLLLEGEVMPAIEATAQDSLATVDITPGKIGEEPTVVICTAEDGSESKYFITWTVSSINTAKTATRSDVLMKQISGTDQIIAYSIRANTWFAVYDHYGHLMFNDVLPACNPNDATVVVDHTGNEKLIDASGDGLTFTLPTHGQTYFYLFYSGKQRIESGKICLH
jgi:hypothetical protein